MTRKKSLGMYLTIISMICAIVSLVAYIMNAQTTYFKNMGIQANIVAGIVVAVVILAVYVIIGLKNHPIWADVIPVISCVLLMISFANFLSARVNAIAAIMTFENNANNMADLSSAIVGIAACLIAVIIAVVASFFDITVEKEA